MNMMQRRVIAQPSTRSFSSRRTHVQVHATFDTSLFKLPIFTARSAPLLPAANGTLRIFEPRYLQMFEKMQEENGGAQEGPNMRFGMSISADAAPPHLMSDASISGQPKVGVVATVKGVQRQEDGTLLVQYEGTSRYQILSVLNAEPYVTAYCMQLADSQPDGRQTIDQLEKQVYQELIQVVRLSNELAWSYDSDLAEASGGNKLPESVNKYAPTTSQRTRSLSEALIDAGYSSAGYGIAMWQSQGTVYGPRYKSGKPVIDPYTLAAEKVMGWEWRQEMFSFAAASCLELDNPERLALLNSRDTEARLAWILAAISPYRAELQAKAALSKALGGSGESNASS